MAKHTISSCVRSTQAPDLSYAKLVDPTAPLSARRAAGLELVAHLNAGGRPPKAWSANAHACRRLGVDRAAVAALHLHQVRSLTYDLIGAR